MSVLLSVRWLHDIVYKTWGTSHDDVGEVYVCFDRVRQRARHATFIPAPPLDRFVYAVPLDRLQALTEARSPAEAVRLLQEEESCLS